MKIKNLTLLCFFSIAFSQISVNELQKFSNSDLDKIRQQLEVETKAKLKIENKLSAEMSKVSIAKNLIQQIMNILVIIISIKILAFLITFQPSRL